VRAGSGAAHLNSRPPVEMRVLHVTPSYPPTSITGPPAAVEGLCRALRARGVDARVSTTDDSGRSRNAVEVNRWSVRNEVPVFYGRRLGWSGDLSPALHRCIAEEAGRSDLVHVTAVYSWPLFSVAARCAKTRTPYVISTRGSLAPAALAWRAWKKAWFNRFGGAKALAGASGFHATSETEAEHVRTALPGSRVCVVPNGAELPPDDELRRLTGNGCTSSVVFLGRLDPHKNPELLLRAWARAARHRPLGNLVLAGPDVANLEPALRAVARGLKCEERISFPGPVHGEQKASLLATARVLVLPSRSENFGNVVAEALAHATPVIASRGTPWNELPQKGCGWWVDANEHALARAIGEALEISDAERIEMGARGRRWIAEAFSWSRAAENMRNFYEETLDSAGSRPR